MPGGGGDRASDGALFESLRAAIRQRKLRLKFKTDPIALLFEALYSGPKGGTITFIALAPLLYLILIFSVLALFAIVAHYVPLIAPVLEFLTSGKAIAGIVIGMFVLVYWAWRPGVALSSVDAWERLWRGGALSLSTRDGSIRCDSPDGDWRAVARDVMARG